MSVGLQPMDVGATPLGDHAPACGADALERVQAAASALRGMRVLHLSAAGGEGGIPDWLHGAGGIGTVAPGQSGTATVLLEPGTYYAQDDEGDEGGIAKFEVTGEAAEAELPSTDATIVASEYKFTTDGLKAGANRVTFDNAGEELHHAIAAPINDGKTIADVKKFFMSEGVPSGPPPVDFEAGVGTAVLDGGAKEVTDLELKAGRYAFVCFIPDREGGPPHFVKGMLQEVEIPG